MSRRLGVRCDVGQSIGVGHVMRCASLAEEFRRRGWEVRFAADTHSVSLAAARLADAGFGLDVVPRSVEEHLGWVACSKIDAVVLDSYTLEPAVSRAIISKVPLLTLIDGQTRGQSGSLFLDQNYGAEKLPWPEASVGGVAAPPRLAGHSLRPHQRCFGEPAPGAARVEWRRTPAAGGTRRDGCRRTD